MFLEQLLFLPSIATISTLQKISKTPSPPFVDVIVTCTREISGLALNLIARKEGGFATMHGIIAAIDTKHFHALLMADSATIFHALWIEA